MKLSDLVVKEIKGIWGNEPKPGDKVTPIIKTNNMSYEGYISFDNLTYRTIPENKLTKSYLNTGDLLIEKSGGTKTHSVGYVNIFEGESNKFVCNNFILALRLNDKIVMPKYLFYQLKYKYESGLFSDCYNKTTGIQNLQVKTYLSKNVIIHNHSEQKLITEELDEITNLIHLNKRRIDVLNESIKSRFIEMFGDVNKNTLKFKSFKIGDQFALGAGGTPKTSEPKYWENGTIPWIGSNMCQDTIIYENDGKYITEDGFEHSSTKLFKPDTVLVALVGATIGKTALLKFETTTNQNVLGIWKIAEAGFNPYYVFYYMQAIYYKFKELGDNSFKMASKAFVSELDILKPDLKAQNEFAKFVKLIDKSKFVVQQQIKDLKELLDKKMNEYFGG